MKTLKLQNIELYISDWEKLHENKKIFIFKYKKVFQLHYSTNCGYYLQEFNYLKMDKNKAPYTLRGRFVALSKDSANSLVETSKGASYKNIFVD